MIPGREKVRLMQRASVVFLSCLCLSVNSQSEDGNILNYIMRSLRDVIDSLDLPSSAKESIQHDIIGLFAVKYVDEIKEQGSQPKENLFEELHYAMHDLLDNSGLNASDLLRVHSSIHHIFSDIYLGSSCYPKYNENHTGCLAERRVQGRCSILQSGVSGVEKDVIVSLHNRLRSQVAQGLIGIKGFQPEASDMKAMVSAANHGVRR